MLVLSRKQSEQIVIGDNVVITVVKVAGGKIRIGVEAPPEVSIHRKEIWDAIQREGECQQ